MNKYYSWRPIESHVYGWSKSLEKIINSFDLPKLDGPSIYIGSDYSGDHQDSIYDVYSIMYTDLAYSREWNRQRTLVRNVLLPDGRRMSFKGLNDIKKMDALMPFLNAADMIRGVSLTVLVNKKVGKLCISSKEFKSVVDDKIFKGKWKHKSLETAMRVCYVISLLIAGLSHERQDISWISDEDDMFANSIKTLDVQRIIGSYSDVLVKHELGSLGMGTCAIDPGDFLEEDITAIPDIIAGSLAETVTKLSKYHGSRVPDLINLVMPYNLSYKSRLICDWIWNVDKSLKKIVVKIEDHNDGYRISRFDMVEVLI